MNNFTVIWISMNRRCEWPLLVCYINIYWAQKTCRDSDSTPALGESPVHILEMEQLKLKEVEQLTIGQKRVAMDST
jgi:hypothetical protein